MSDGKTALKRAIVPMPGFVRDALLHAGLLAAYDARPPYQRNDYLAWITRAKRQATIDKRLAQMLEELAAEECYMGMAWGTGTRDRP
jgi:uncharacterized protein YdeI (YjbR/CyaY-like superfamily)